MAILANAANKKHLTVLLLSCWQREYDKRPYRHFKFHLHDFEERMERSFIPNEDFRVIVKYIEESDEWLSVSICGINLSTCNTTLLLRFLIGLQPIKFVELKLIEFPYIFFVMLCLKSHILSFIELSLEGCPLTNRDISMLRTFLITNQYLRTLNVSSCSLTQYNFAELADGVHKSQSLQSLNCSRLIGVDLSLDTEKMAHIISSLIWRNQLAELIMQKCEFDAHDMKIIAEYLSSDKCVMKKLNVAYNKIGSDGTKHILNAVSKVSKLEQLDISGNSIGTHGGQWVAAYMSSCRKLDHLYINNNGIDADTINLILTSMKKPISFKKLYVYGNKFNSKSAKILHRLLDARVVIQDTFDITFTLNDYRIVPWR